MPKSIHNFFTSDLSVVDPEINVIVGDELKRQQNQVELIASENFASHAVLMAQGSILTNKYAEGYPHKRYYGGCEVVDKAEILAIERAKKLFGCLYERGDYVYVYRTFFGNQYILVRGNTAITYSGKK